jgi:trimethylamine--corrinoid protein Co-methyltransferase
MLLMVELLIGLRAEIIQRGVSPAPVVERFDVEEQVRPGLVTGVVQAMVEGTLSTLMQALCGANLVHDVGYLESGLTSSYEMVVAIDEVISMVKYIMSGIEINEDTLALDVIDRVGPGGNFIADEHTLKHFRGGWFPRLLDRQNYAAWASDGKQTMGDRLNKRVKEILAEHVPEPLPSETAGRIKEIICAAESRLGL